LPDATRAISHAHSASPASETISARSYSHHTHTDYGEAEPTIGIARQVNKFSHIHSRLARNYMAVNSRSEGTHSRGLKQNILLAALSLQDEKDATS
jgi:hypothetical protein